MKNWGKNKSVAFIPFSVYIQYSMYMDIYIYIYIYILFCAILYCVVNV